VSSKMILKTVKVARSIKLGKCLKEYLNRDKSSKALFMTQTIMP
jgi:hypothetical protein